MFTSARLQLTLYYVLIIVIITGSISFLFYHRAASVIDTQRDRIRVRLENEGLLSPPGPLFPQHMNRIFIEDTASAKHDLAKQLILINGLIILVTGSSAYFLSGRTLVPIKQAMDEQKRFIADAAHELKTPITALKTSLEVNLMDQKISKSTKKILSENLEDISGLETLTESLLKLARVDGQTLKLKPVSIQPIVDQAVKHITPLAHKKSITLKTNRISSKFQVTGDPPSLVDLLLILLDNAVKYSPSQSAIFVTVKTTSKSVAIKVRDHGIGIDKHHLPHIFDRFYRVDSSRSKITASGYGLGLSVAQKIVSEHGGAITVASKLQQGTTFTVSLPRTIISRS